MHACERCGAPIEDKWRLCYLCNEDQIQAARDARIASNAQTPPTPVYTPPQVVYAPKRTESTQDARQEAIAKAHDENMLANELLVNAILKLTEAVNRRSVLLAESMGAK